MQTGHDVVTRARSGLQKGARDRKRCALASSKVFQHPRSPFCCGVVTVCVTVCPTHCVRSTCLTPLLVLLESIFTALDSMALCHVLGSANVLLVWPM